MKIEVLGGAQLPKMSKVVKDAKNPNEVSFKQRLKDLKYQEQEEQKIIKNAHKSPFRAFYQINKEHSDEMQWLLDKNPKAFKVLLFLLNHMDKYNAVMCSYTVIQEALGIGRTTASMAVKLLKEHGFIAVMKSGSSNIYVVNNNLAWNSWGNNVQYCEFPANIILSGSEQKEHAAEIITKKIQTVKTRKNSTKK